MSVKCVIGFVERRGRNHIPPFVLAREGCGVNQVTICFESICIGCRVGVACVINIAGGIVIQREVDLSRGSDVADQA